MRKDFISIPVRLFLDSRYLPKQPKKRAICISSFATLAAIQLKTGGAPITHAQIATAFKSDSRNSVIRRIRLLQRQQLLLCRRLQHGQEYTLRSASAGEVQFKLPGYVFLDSTLSDQERATLVAVGRQVKARRKWTFDPSHVIPLNFLAADLRVSPRTVADLLTKLSGFGLLEWSGSLSSGAVRINISPLLSIDNHDREIRTYNSSDVPFGVSDVPLGVVQMCHLAYSDVPLGAEKIDLKFLLCLGLRSPLVLKILVLKSLVTILSKKQKEWARAQHRTESTWKVPGACSGCSENLPSGEQQLLGKLFNSNTAVEQPELKKQQRDNVALEKQNFGRLRRVASTAKMAVPEIEEKKSMAKRKHLPEDDGFDFMAARESAAKGSNRASEESEATPGKVEPKDASEWGTLEFLRFIGARYAALTGSIYPNLLSGKNLSLMKQTITQQDGESDEEFGQRKLQLYNILCYTFDNWDKIQGDLKLRELPTVSLFYSMSDRLGMHMAQTRGSIVKPLSAMSQREKIEGLGKLKACRNLGIDIPAALKIFEQHEEELQKEVDNMY